MSNRILFVSSGGATDCKLRLALTKTAPEYQVHSASTFEEIKAAHQPAMILLDITWSGEPSCEMLRWLKTDERYRRIPVFVLAPAVETSRINEAYASGADSCLLVGSTPEEFESIAHGIAAYATLLTPLTP